MIATVDWLWELDGWIVATGILCAVAASLLGNFLVLRKTSLLGDAISHAVLPGLAAAFLITGSRHSLPMFIGAALVGVLTAAMTQWIRDSGKVDEGASMGVVFTTLFALGLVMIVRAADQVDLDPGCVLYGAIELTPLDTVRIGAIDVPRSVVTLGLVNVLNLAFVAVFFKELRLTSFDPAYADAVGFGSQVLHYGLMTLVAITAVASFESVGNILVVAMFIVPPATARLLTNRMGAMVVYSALIGAASAVAGHWSAVSIPRWFGFSSTTTAGMIAVASGVFLTVAILISPKDGILFRHLRRLRLTSSILRDDLLALLFRFEERDPRHSFELEPVAATLGIGQLRLRAILAREVLSGSLQRDGQGYRLTPDGRHIAVNLVRAHRLWEQYLINQAGVAADRIHDHAEQFEHVADRQIRDELERETEFPTSDPHGSPIPGEQEPPGAGMPRQSDASI
jgi:manganese/zinc/iron transport system permease protein